MKKVTLRLLGPARSFSADELVSFVLPVDATVANFRSHVKTWLSKNPSHEKLQPILDRAVFATRDKIVFETESIIDQLEYLLIPPVSGG